MVEENLYKWTDNPTVSGMAICDTDVLNECLMHLKYDKKDGGTGLQMFDTILKDRILTYEETKGLALQGTYVYKEALAGSRYGYPDFYNKVIEEFNQATTTETVNGVTVKVHSNGHKFYNIADKTGIDEFFNTMGSAWFYGVDTANERIFLPRDNYFAVTGDVSVAGNGLALGITDGTNTGVWGSYGTNTISSNSFLGSSVGTDVVSGYAGANNRAIGVITDPTKSGIEGKLSSNTDKYLYICVGNTTNYEGVTDVVNQGMDILEQINAGFVPKDSMEEVPCIIETYVNGTSGYRIWSDGYCEQWGVNEYTATNEHAISLLKRYRDTLYNVLLSKSDGWRSGNNGQAWTSLVSKSLDSFSIRNNVVNITDWHTFGYLAEGEY